MGLFEKVNGAINLFNTSSTGHETFKRMFSMCSDSQLLEWWANRYNCHNIDDAIIEMAEKELRRRGLNY